MTTAGSDTNDTFHNMVSQMYTFNSSWHRHKSIANGHCSNGSLPYVGFPGLSLTPIPESPLLADSVLNDDSVEREGWLNGDIMDQKDTWNPKTMKNGSLPKHWMNCNGREDPSAVPLKNGDVESGQESCMSKTTTKTSCSVNVHVVTTFLPKDEPMTTDQKRAHICKLLLFALCGFVIVAGIVLWIFSPAFT